MKSYSRPIYEVKHKKKPLTKCGNCGVYVKNNRKYCIPCKYDIDEAREKARTRRN